MSIRDGTAGPGRADLTHDGARLALHTAELAALRTAAATATAYEHEAAVSWFRPDIAAPLRGGVPAAPLVAAVGDLASAAHAAARALHFAAEATPPYRPARTTTLAVAVIRAADIAVDAAAHRRDTGGGLRREELAHAAAFAAHTAAEALEGDEPGGARAPSSRRAAAQASGVVSFPQSSRRLIRLLSESIEATARQPEETGHGSAEARLSAARAARDAAEHAMRAYDRCRVNGAPMRVICRVARLASRASAHAGFAALRRPGVS